MSPRRRQNPPAPTKEAVLADDLRDRILSGELAAGTALREQVLTALTGFSHHTVRTALSRLTAERLVQQEPYRGFRVTSFTAEDALALQQLRGALESEAVRLLRSAHGSAWPEAVTQPIEAAVHNLDTVASSHPDNWPMVAAAHAAVHRALVAAAASPRIRDAYAQLDSEMLLLLVNLRPNYPAEEVAADHHDFLLQVQQKGERAVRKHLAHGLQQIFPRSEQSPRTQLQHDSQ